MLRYPPMHPATLRAVVYSIRALREAMRRDRGCWQNPGYLSRFFVDGTLVTSYGWHRFCAEKEGLPPHSSGPIFVLDCAKQKVAVEGMYFDEDASCFPPLEPGTGSLSFEEFVSIPSDAATLRLLFRFDVEAWLEGVGSPLWAGEAPASHQTH